MGSVAAGDPSANILIVDDTLANLSVLALMLKKEGHRVRPVPSGKLALSAAATDPPDLILLDINMPEMDGFEVCRRLKQDPALRSIPVIFLSALTETSDKVRAFIIGGVDYVTKPFQAEELLARVRTHLTLRRLQRQVEAHNTRLQELVHEQVREISDSQLATIVALSNLTESRDDDTGTHVKRVQAYCRLLATRLRAESDFASRIDDAFITSITLDLDELAIMHSHTTIGARTLRAVQAQYPGNALIAMGIDIAAAHHERWDGTGYPRGLADEDIPLAARILNIADQYDALRSVRPYKPSMTHIAACGVILYGDTRTMPVHFDPRILAVFRDCADELAGIYRALYKEAPTGR
jgi:putative two-component system response regulator